MPPRLSLRPLKGRGYALRQVAAAPTPSVCLFCSLSTRGLAPRPRRKSLTARRNYSTATATATATTTSSTASSTPSTSSNPRQELQAALRDLKKHAANHVDLSRVQLALNALQQEAGDETIRVAILGLAHGADSARTTKEMLRLLLADPLLPPQAWEKELLDHDISKPLIIRVRPTQHLEHSSEAAGLMYANGGLLKEINVSAPGMNGNKLELLLVETNPLADTSEAAVQEFEQTVLVPTVDIPISSTGRYNPITTPVHKSLLVTDGLIGAASLMKLPFLNQEGTIAAVVDLAGYEARNETDLPFVTIDTRTAGEGIQACRQSLDRAFEYEKLWFKSRVPALTTWLKAGTGPTDDGTTKEAVRVLIASVLKNTIASIEREEARRLSAALSTRIAPAAVSSLNKALRDWSEKAHAELQGEMDRAFSSQRWSKLNWWKLFWRVDDVGMLSSEMLSQRFLPRAERNVIYLAGQVDGSGLFGQDNGKTVYSLPSLRPTTESTIKPDFSAVASPVTTTSLKPGTKWPTHITFTRNYLQSESVPALQALAQKLVFQSASLSGLTTALGTMMYLSSYGTSESGAVAALGIAWSLRTLQKKWERAREYWQSEVREEGRKAVRAVEFSVGEALDTAARNGGSQQDQASLAELLAAREFARRAEDALERLK
ncbi:hypothetical protein BD289DRAFT_363595 [Coniella lustricola]|uniref:Mmc1 C-terminal domain-containing protein n=1 Tax=Coniella lustricola TaxID=2025994 RepID=A0A2T3AEZ7_9PEZI|nr:hypothetical protein BD289DRAFT_363595 [Coniella lustricola]